MPSLHIEDVNYEEATYEGQGKGDPVLVSVLDEYLGIELLGSNGERTGRRLYFSPEDLSAIARFLSSEVERDAARLVSELSDLLDYIGEEIPDPEETGQIETEYPSWELSVKEGERIESAFGPPWAAVVGETLTGRRVETTLDRKALYRHLKLRFANGYAINMRSRPGEYFTVEIEQDGEGA